MRDLSSFCILLIWLGERSKFSEEMEGSLGNGASFCLEIFLVSTAETACHTLVGNFAPGIFPKINGKLNCLKTRTVVMPLKYHHLTSKI